MTFLQQKPFSGSAEENKQIILEALHPLLVDKQSMLEIASGTGQHAVHFGKALPHLTWQTSELAENIPGILQWLEEAQLPNVLAPLALNVSDANWPTQPYDAIFSANSFHIMSEAQVSDFFSNLPKVLKTGTLVMIYGPFNINGRFTSESNAQFDCWLKQRNPLSGIKDKDWCDGLAKLAGLQLLDDIIMPQNNRILVWKAL
ncbi:DUF938 domain-containing protein [Thiosulfativibrio zosterae]|uniref:Methylase n=1 Tax=Thiosulfativibrio zosterae TaxID=2675053 RepID=A0A6F8PMD9_9GAMM|nr:DUF938 domain-containing protein [Thiosulfativibrio zosterae]BBP43256.1 hypothetical protein THMIRHAT_10020 [Thiosulfativibrio zosterae]